MDRAGSADYNFLKQSVHNLLCYFVNKLLLSPATFFKDVKYIIYVK